jgi:uncharacterized damage-inducible protein DinB
MKTLSVLLISMLLMTNLTIAQQKELPYKQIPDYPDVFNADNVAARVVDGLGFRYYWATEGLTEGDLSYQPSEDVRTIRQTLEHIYGLSRTIVNAPQSKVNSPPEENLSFDELRRRTLENIQLASTLLKEGKEGDMENYRIIFKNGDNTTEYPFWNMLNGPMADAIYHTGQVVAFRRAAGNPIPSGVRVFLGTRTE